MTVSSGDALLTVAVGAGLVALGVLMYVRGWARLIIGAWPELLPFPEAAAEYVGTVVAVVGALTVAMGVLGAAGLAPAILWWGYYVTVAVLAFGYPFAAGPYIRWRRSRL